MISDNNDSWKDKTDALLIVIAELLYSIGTWEVEKDFEFRKRQKTGNYEEKWQLLEQWRNKVVYLYEKYHKKIRFIINVIYLFGWSRSGVGESGHLKLEHTATELVIFSKCKWQRQLIYRIVIILSFAK
jgi:hypothetical protein